MAWLDRRKRRDGTSRWRIREEINGKIITVIRNAGAWKEIAKKRLDEYEKTRAAGDSAAASLVTPLEKAKHGWIIDTTRSPKTIVIYEGAFNAFVKHAKATKIQDFSKDNIDGWRDDMENGRLLWRPPNGGRWHRYSPTTVKIMVSSVKDFLRYCARRDLVSFKLAQSIKVRKVESSRRFLTREEATSLIKSCRVDTYVQQGVACRNPRANSRLRKIILFGLYTGMRLSEVLGAAWSRVSLQEVLRRLPDGRLVSTMVYSLFIPKAKKHKQRTVALHPVMARILGASKHVGENSKIFPDWTANSLGQARRRAVKRSGLERVRFHDLRHSFVRNYLKSCAGTVAQLREHTGHENLASLDPYSHFANEDIAATIPNYRIK